MVETELAAGVLTDLLFEEPGVGRCLVAPDGTVLRANAEWLRSTSLSLDEVLGADIIDLFPGTRDMALAMHARARAGHRVEVPRHAQRIQGRDTWWEGSITPVPLEGGTGLLITAREVSGRWVLLPEADGSLPPAAEVLRTIADDAPFAVFATSADGHCVFANRYVAALLGATPEQLVGRVSSILPRGAAQRATETEARAAPGHAWTQDVISTRNGERTLLTARFPVGLHDGEIGTCGIAFDITEQVRAQDAAKRAEAVLAHAGAMAQLGAWWIDASNEQDLSSDPLRWSDEVYRIFGYQPGEVPVSNELFFQHVHPDDRQHVIEAVAQALAAGERYAIEHRIVRRDGVERTVLERGETQRDDAGRLTRIVGAVQDVTERKRAEEALRESTALLRAISDTSSDVIFAKDREGRLRFANPATLALIGKPLDQVIGRTDAEFLDDPEAARRVLENDRRIMESEVAEDVEEAIPLPDGTRRTWFSRKSPYRDASGQVKGLVGISRDITVRKRAEDALRETEGRYRGLFENMAEEVRFWRVERDADGEIRTWRLVDANPPALRTWSGRSLDELRGKTTDEILGACATEHLLDTVRGVMTNRVPFSYEDYFPQLDRHFRVTMVPLGDECFITTGADITAAKKAQRTTEEHNDQLREVDRRKSEFLALLSHELRNPLAPIRNSVYLLERARPGSEQALRATEVVRRQTEHLTRLVDDLLDITRISRGKIALQRTRVDLRDIVQRTTDDMLSVFAQAAVTLRVDYGARGPVWIDADQTRMAQVLGNLLQNAVKFTQSGGSVAVSVSAEGGRAELCVRDDGAGIDPSAIERMFEPFVQADQSLARTSGGLGLGLALVKGIVELHGGSVRARSEGVGRGAEFVVSIPQVEAGAALEPEGVARAESAGKRVLVIEDNVDSAQSLADILELAGHDVRITCEGSAGLALAREFRPDVIVCDIGLPGLDGYEVARAIRRDDTLRSTRLIALSGYAQPEDRQRTSDAGFDMHIAKPPDVDKLIAAIAKR